MLTPNAILSAETAAAYYPTVDLAVLNSNILQDIVDDAMADVNEILGLDLSYGPGVEVSQTFQPDASMHHMLRMIVPMDMTAPVTITEGPDSRVMSAAEFTRYTNMVISGGVYQNYYWFDRGHIFGTNFLSPTIITYTPRDSVFRMVRQYMLELIKVRFISLSVDGSPTVGLGSIMSIRDEQQQVNFDTGSAVASKVGGRILTPREAILNSLLLQFRGPRIG